MKMSNFENPTWQTAAILKIIISPYLSRNLSEFYQTSMRTQILSQAYLWQKKSEISKFKMADGRHVENQFFAYNSAPSCPIKTKFGVRRHNRTHTKGRWWKCPISKIQHGRRGHFENHYIAISQPQIVQIARNLVCRHNYNAGDGNDRNSQIQNGGCTRH